MSQYLTADTKVPFSITLIGHSYSFLACSQCKIAKNAHVSFTMSVCPRVTTQELTVLIFLKQQTLDSQRKSTKMQQCIKIFYFIFIWSSACFGRHTALHHEPTTALAASGFVYMEGCWTCSCWTC